MEATLSATDLVCFDLDGTLIDDDGLPGAVAATGEALQAAGYDVDGTAVPEANRRAWQGLWPEVEDEWMRGGGRDAMAIGLEGWRRTLAELGSDDPGLAALAHRMYKERAEQAVRAYADAVPALDALERLGVRVAVASNGSAREQRWKLRAAGLETRFETVVVSSEVGAAKPDPAVLHRVLELLDVDPEHAWYVGDNFGKDVVGGQAAGMRTVWLNREGRPAPDDARPPTAVIRSLDELGRALDSSAGGGGQSAPRELPRSVSSRGRSSTRRG